MVSPTESESYKEQGNTAFQQGNHSKAIEFFSKAIELDSNNHVLYSNRSAAYSSLKKYEEALNDAEKTVQLKPDWSKGYGRKGAALVGMSRIEDAKKAYEEGLKYDPSNISLLKSLEDIKTKEPASGVNNMIFNLIAKNPKLMHLLGDEGFMRKLADIQQNPSSIGKYLNDPQMMEVFSGMMSNQASSAAEEAAFEEENFPMKVAQFEEPANDVKVEKAPEPEPEAPKELSDRDRSNIEKDIGNEHYKKRDFDNALHHYDRALEIDSTNIAVLTNKSAVLFEKGEFENCVALCEEAIEKGREIRVDYTVIAKAFGRIGSCYTKLGNLEEAIKYFNKSLTEHRTADILNKLRDAEKLLEQQKKEAYIDPQKAEECRNLGNELFKKGNFAEALKQYSDAIKRDPKDPRAYSNRAACYTKLAAFPEALKDCDECLKVDPNFVKAYIRKAAIEFLKKEFSRCLETCQEGLKADTEGKHKHEIDQQIQKCYYEINRQNATGDKEEILKNAMQDPEIQQIMTDPVMQAILQQMQNDPKALMDHMKNPVIANKIRKLMASGIIRTA